MIRDKPMVVMVWERVSGAKGFYRVVVAADDDRVFDTCQRHEVDVVMTSEKCRNGTERCCEVANIIRMADDDLVVNVQGDEPLMDVSIPQRLLFNLGVRPELVWTAVRRAKLEEQGKRDVVKCQVRGGYIDWFTRRKTRWGRHVHIGVYGYSVKRLREYVKKGPKPDEERDGMEQLRWRESLACISVDYEGVGVDRPHDIQKVEELLAQVQDDGGAYTAEVVV
jgi:3-deoxy-manno-octulosonate cytidylyltransferase (CMP-KDO synthetase)